MSEILTNGYMVRVIEDGISSHVITSRETFTIHINDPIQVIDNIEGESETDKRIRELRRIYTQSECVATYTTNDEGYMTFTMSDQDLCEMLRPLFFSKHSPTSPLYYR